MPKILRLAGAFASLSVTIVFATPATLDNGFGTGGVSRHALSATSDDSGQAVEIQPDGKIVVASICDRDGAYRICLMRLTVNGALDTSFAQQGIAVTALTTTYPHYNVRLALADDGKIVVATACSLPNDITGGYSRFCLARLTANGMPDASFGTAGVVTTTMSGGTQPIDTPVAVFVRSTGAIVVAGNCRSGDDPAGASRRVCSARYLPQSGELDSAYGTGGRAFHTSAMWTPTDIYANAAIMAPNGSLRIAGDCAPGAQQSCVIATNGDGTLANNFGNQGLKELGLGSGFTSLTAITRQRDGNLIVGGACTQSSDTVVSLCFTRLNATGGLIDVTFSPNFVPSGIVRTAIPGNADVSLSSLAIDGDGAILAAGGCGDGMSPEKMCVIRYRPEGYLDTSFSASGIFVGSSPSYRATSVAIHPNGRIILAGGCRDRGSFRDTCVTALEGGPRTFARCSLDLDGDGIVSASDSVIWSRVMFDFDYARAVSGVSFPPAATRTTAVAIREYLASQCGIEQNRPIR